jgi:hypothetical protein
VFIGSILTVVAVEMLSKQAVTSHYKKRALNLLTITNPTTMKRYVKAQNMDQLDVGSVGSVVVTL